ncbi:MAG TPA: hypothetical protein VHM01_00110 [Alphaproteobacteria bacterium]|nr:hypothetical protein [Alphaproteobacteria bacterium]
MMPLRAVLPFLLLALQTQFAFAGEKLLKLRQYTFQCGAQECVGWRHSFAFVDPAARNAELPRDAYVEVYTTQEVDALIDAALARRPDAALTGSDDERRKLRDDIAAEVVTQLTRLMAEQEAQTRAWLRELVREEMKAVGTR